MKKKKIQKKLDLSKQTIANLGNEEMAEVQGGCVTELISLMLDCDDPEVEKKPTYKCGR